ncbi:MAG: hypothetical protein A4E69_00025 [Syntrophus sp. PtaB.Bin138]|nr:MAG: hypothetical protein A4E69_00025 [Syntrophus sp. PtaB.Bin138]
MSNLDFTGFSSRKPLSDIMQVPPRVESVYSLTQHVWAGEGDSERTDAKQEKRCRLETLDEFFIDPVRGYLNRILEKIADGEGQGFWVQAEFGVGKSHLLAATAVLVLGRSPAWDRAKQREDEEKKAGPGARIDSLWRKRIENKKIFPVVFSLEGSGGGHELKLEDFVLEEAQKTFALWEGKPLAIYPEEHLARLFLKEHEKAWRNDLKTFLADKRLMRGLPNYGYDELLDALKTTASQKDAGRLLMAFYRHKGLMPKIPTERGERLERSVRDILDAGYEGIFLAIDEMSEYLRRSKFESDDEDCLLVLSSSLAKAQGLPIWTLVAAQAAHTNPQKIIGPDRLREEPLEHKAERFRDIVVQRTRTITDQKAVDVYYGGYRSLIPWVKQAASEEFTASFPFPPDAVSVLRQISLRLTGTRSTISFLHRALKSAVEKKENNLIPLWKVFDDLMSYNETPSAAGSGSISIRNKFRGEVAALEAAQATLKRITDGQLSRAQNRSRAERILNTLFLYHIAGVAGLTKEQILDAVCDLKPGEDELEAQLGHYETILEEMKAKLRSQIRFHQGRFEFLPKETSQYDDLVHAATERLKNDPQLLWQKIDRIISYSDSEAPSDFAGIVPAEDGRLAPFKLERWHGQERSGRVTIADLTRVKASHFEVDTHGSEDDFLVILARRPVKEKDVNHFLKDSNDPRLIVWVPADLRDEERLTLAGVLAHLLVEEENKDTNIAREALKAYKRDARRAYNVLLGLYLRGIAKTTRTSLAVSPIGGVQGAVEAMASEALDTCYTSRHIDFGNRKFDAQGAVKLINGLVKRGKAVSEGDQLWSAVENFAPPLELVRAGNIKRLDPTDSEFYKSIRKRVEERGGLGLDIKTVYNWFTGYDPKDGQESPGLTRRMVDIYLLCLAQQGIIRIVYGKKGEWIDRSSIAGIEFKPEHLRGMSRVELPRPLEDWEIFYPYLEILLGNSDGSLGPKYDKATADEALKSLWESHWLEHALIERMDNDIRSLFDLLGAAHENPYEDVLIYWLNFADEPRPEPFNELEVFNAIRRAVVDISDVTEATDLTPDHLDHFKSNYGLFQELRTSFDKTSLILIRAAKLASVPIPEGKKYKDIGRAQKEVLAELKKASALLLSPDTVTTRLEPRLTQLEDAYIPAYLDELMNLNNLQNELEEVADQAGQSEEILALKDFISDVSEAKRIIDQCDDNLRTMPLRLRKSPEDREKAKTDVKREGTVKSIINNEGLSLRKLVEECGARQEIIDSMQNMPKNAIIRFAAFLQTPGVVEGLQRIEKPVPVISQIVSAKKAQDIAEILLMMNQQERKALAKQLKTVLGGKLVKTVCLQSFEPETNLIWEAGDIDTVVNEFRDYLESQWEDGCYIKVEK